MWITAEDLMGNPMLINPDHVAVASDTGSRTTAITLRSGTTMVVGITFKDFTAKLQQAK